jgi:hypothetical protein
MTPSGGHPQKAIIVEGYFRALEFPHEISYDFLNWTKKSENRRWMTRMRGKSRQS